MDRPQLLIYADTHAGVGAGHLVRCVALAQAWVDQGGRCHLVTERWPEGFDAAMADIEVDEIGSIDEASHLTELIERDGPAWLVIDSYRMTPAAMAAIPRHDSRLAVLRDHGMAAPDADVIIDQNDGAQEIDYVDDAPDALVLAGADFALLRRSFGTARARWITDARPGLVLAGGSPSPATVELISATLGGLGNAPVDLLGGGFDEVILPLNVRRLGVVSDPADQMAGRPWALSPAGSTVWELCCLRVPSVLFSAAPNQEGVGLAVAEAGAGTYLGALEDITADDAVQAVTALRNDGAWRDQMAGSAGALVDGGGAARVVAELRAALIELEDATDDHADVLFRWRNDPDVRTASFSSDPITWDAHIDWLNRRLSDPGTWMFVAEVDGEPVGQIRFDAIDGGRLRVGVSLAAEARGQWLAAPVIVAGTRKVLARSGASSVLAEVKTENERAAAAFVAAGYALAGKAAGVLTYERHAD